MVVAHAVASAAFGRRIQGLIAQVLQDLVATSVQRGQVCCFLVVCGGAMMAVARWWLMRNCCFVDCCVVVR